MAKGKSFKFLVVVLSALSLTFWVLTLDSPAEALPQPVSYSITVTAAIGEPKLTLFGWTSPHARVELKGSQVVEETIANQAGYFFFHRVYLPPPQKKLFGNELVYPELCLTSIDTQGLVSFPACLAPLPVGPFDLQVGPVLLPPTISLEQGNFSAEQQVAAQGKTIPNSKVTIYLANNFSGEPSLIQLFTNLFAPPVDAYSLPQYQIQADEWGHFEFNLPAIQPSTWKLFAATTYFEAPSPKSNTLTFKILSFWEWLWQRLKWFLFAFFGLLRPYLWQLIIIGEVVIIGSLLWWRRRLMKAHLRSLR
jgi:hypothetical protein